ncbi:MAG: non-hydrolyzing UDP-N-acetylglucosamine 2-epimerase [Terasakiella sp.]|uniref:non-hydrolyzing UDP-N-acetylglucosamine 2-epimerase n=1 Tax=unclassified Terasakiella TaxID=2614952 RepID=UPI003B00CBF3
MSKKILTIVGARPQFIKAAAVSRAFLDFPDMTEIMVHTGQHFDADMSDIFFDELDIPKPVHSLNVNGGGHGEMTGRMLEKLERVMLDEKPDMVLIYGDTNSTLAGALAAVKLLIPVAHIEAGLRSFNRAMPEEINRVMADHVSTLLFCPTQSAVDNLNAEGITKGVFKVGDVMFDATNFATQKAQETSSILEKLGLREDQYAVSTLHRAENTDTCENLTHVLDWLKDKAKECPVVLPLHPRTRGAAERFGLNFDGLTLCDPVGYLDMAKLLSASKAVYTDSGGLQKEAYFHKKPCVTLRDETEWVETIQCGWNRLWKVCDYKERKDIDEYGDGRASHVILKAIEDYLG